MKKKFTLGARVSLVLSLAIASSLVANVAQAESRQGRQAREERQAKEEQQSKEELSRTITRLVDLGADRQWLVEASLNRATATHTQVQHDSEPINTRVLGGVILPVSVER